jgi:SPP1 family predicted phage head-tail adaptor
VDIQIPDGDLEDFTSTDATWSLSFQQWAEIVPLSGDEEITAKQINPRASHRITMRWSDGVDTTRMRFVHQGVTYNVASSKNTDMRNRIWTFIVSEEKS